tara:strand:- start:300 stop:446 length:147 start_codon:yes stop_codon:yes gene_type:complete
MAKKVKRMHRRAIREGFFMPPLLDNIKKKQAAHKKRPSFARMLPHIAY